MTDTTINPPLRQLTRLRAEMMMASVNPFVALFPDAPTFAPEFGVVARVCLPDWVQEGALARPKRPTLGIPIGRMAHSLGYPLGTVRRHAKTLQNLGLFVSTSEGIALATTARSEARITRYFLQLHDLFLQLLEDMSATCDIDLAIGEAPAFGAGDIVARALDMLLQQIDTYRLPGETRLLPLLWGALTAAAVRNVTYDPVLSRRFADTIPTDDVRIGISLRRLAAAVSIPYATAWRHIQSLHAVGLVTRVDDDRWTILTHNLLQDSVSNFSTPPSTFLFRMIRELALMGLDPARAGDHYALGRPPRADLGPF